MKIRIKYILIFLSVILISGISFAQNAPIDFETGGYGADWTWTVFENSDTPPPLEIVSNPDTTGINSSSTVAKITALVAGAPWVGCESLHGSDIGSFSFDATNSTVKVMVYKSVISDVGIKFAEANSDAQPEVKVANTLINQWEELTFDLSGSIGAGATGIIDQIIFFPDFDLDGRTTENIVYFDNITFSGDTASGSPTVAAPTPTDDAANVISIYSDAYTDVAGTDFNPDWGQATVATEIMIEGNATLKYDGLDYQGTQFGSTQDVSGMVNLHVDYWTEDTTALQLFLISETSGEKSYDFTITTGSWASVEIPLTTFTDQGLTLNDVHQFKFVGNGTVYLDNLYFSGETTSTTGPNAPIDFESGGHGADWTWTVFENDTNPPLEIVDNPSATGINTSSTVAKIIALVSGATWVGCESLHGSDIGTFNLDATNSTVKIMVYKTVISDVGIKFVKPDGWSMGEIKVPNTVLNEWEELTFDMSSKIADGYDQIVVFPDFNARTTENVVYFDNVTFSEQIVSGSPSVAAPTPTDDAANVISIYSDAYTDVAGTDFDPDWGQATDASEVMIEGNATLKYADLNYQGTNFGSTQNVSAMSHVHVDYWTEDATLLEMFLISESTGGAGEKKYVFTVETDSWISMDIPLTHFSDQGLPMNDIFQFKFVGDGTVYLDNLYFGGRIISVEEIQGATPSTYTLEQNYPNPFNPSTKISFSLLEANNVTLKVYNMLGQEVATLISEVMNAGKYAVTFDASDLPTGSYVYSLKAGGFTSVKKMMLIK